MDFPGLCRKRNKDGSERLYWRATNRALALGFKPQYIAIFPENEAELSFFCTRYQAEMLQWIALREGAAVHVVNQHTIATLFREYRTRPESPFNRVKENTRTTYAQLLDTIEGNVGSVKLAEINLAVLHRWYKEARYPEGPNGREYVHKAHSIMKMLRAAVSFGVAIEIAQCVRLHSIFAVTTFEAPGRRERNMQPAEAARFIEKALEMGRFSLALATAIGFECGFRQKDIIGEWLTGRASEFQINRRGWANGLTWADINDKWIIRKKTTKTGAMVSHDLTLAPMAFDLLNRIAPDRRHGPLILDEATDNARPYAGNRYQEEWRKVRDAAGLPADLWSMDARSGAATEADEAGASLEDIRQTLAHTDAKTTARYVRGDSLNQTRRVARARIAHRAIGNQSQS